MVASPAACPGQDDANLPVRIQERAMRCLVNVARRRAGRAPLAASGKLARSGGLKSRDILRCDDFDHEACGRDFAYWIERVGYMGDACGAGENIALGTGAFAAPRAIFRAWIGSAGHRRNILGDYDDLGVGLEIGTLDGRTGVHAWTQHFGRRC
ncbi:MAG TPA: CAP domain-containing protein [Solirubrobacterales bacterium]|nr:CAP domain-containing protein [Solirubrobacterales bacterium]